MEQWQIEAIQKLLETPTVNLEDNTRIYTSSTTYGASRFHVLSQKEDGVQIEQTHIEEKWPSRVTLQSDEVPAILKSLLTWHLEVVKKVEEQKNDPFLTDDTGLGDLDDHAF